MPPANFSATYTGSSERYNELTQRLRTVQGQISILCSPTIPSVKSESGTGTESEATFRELEEEVSILRHELAVLRAQLQEQRGN